VLRISVRVGVRVVADTDVVAKTARHDEHQLPLFEEDTLDCNAPDSEDLAESESSAPDAPRPDRSSTEDTRATVSFVAPDGYQVPADALRRILGLMIDQARRSSETEAS
jgi:hypothetical protein